MSTDACQCDARDLVSAHLRGVEPSPCPVHRPDLATRNARALARLEAEDAPPALNSDALENALRRRLGITDPAA